MISALLLTGALITSAGPPTTNPDLAAYEAAKAGVGRDAEAHVRLALWCEAHGLSAERLKHLTMATLIDPRNTAARGLLGLVAYGGKWLRPDDVSLAVKDDPERKALLQEYMLRRLKAADKAEDQLKLAQWCEKQGLKEQATAHLHHVVRLDPRRDSVWKKLGYKKVAGQWIKADQAAAEKAEFELQTKANKHWKPLLERYREALNHRDKARRKAAEDALAQIGDPRAVPMVWATFVRGDEARQRIALNVFGQIDAPGASRGIAMLAVFSPSPNIRQTATEMLRRRDLRDVAGLLVGLMGETIKYQVRPVLGPGTQGELFVEGKDANVRRLYTPLPPPMLMPGDQLGVNASGMTVATRILGSYWTAFTPVSKMVVSQPNAVNPGIVAPIFQQAGLPAGKTQELTNRIAQNARPSALIINENSNPGGRLEVSSLVQDSVEIPIGQLIADAQNSALVAQEQLSQDVRNIEDHNAPIAETNSRVRSMLKALSGQDLGAEPTQWQKWSIDLQGYAFSQKSSNSVSTPTYIDEVPLAYQPQATPVLQERVVANAFQVTHSCFGAGTAVRTLDGTRPIEDLREGDQVLSQNTTTGALGYQPIIAVFHNPPNATYRIDLGDETIVATGIHRFWKAGKGWVMAREIKAGDRLRTVGGSAVVKSVETDRLQPVFNLQLAGGDNFFVGNRGVLAHDNSIVTPTEKPFDAAPLAELAQRTDP